MPLLCQTVHRMEHLGSDIEFLVYRLSQLERLDDRPLRQLGHHHLRHLHYSVHMDL